MQLKIRATWS